MKLIIAKTEQDFKAAAELFKEYAVWLDFDLGYQNFEEELKMLPIMYGKPKGGLLLLVHKGEYVGCGAIREFEPNVGEIKRMYIKPSHRGKGGGKLLLEAILKLGKTLQYPVLKLDTLHSMKAAVHLYYQYGFYEIPAYRYNPHSGVLYLAIDLSTIL